MPAPAPAGGRYASIAIIAAALVEHERLRRAIPSAHRPTSAWRSGVRPGWRQA
jgi:hypothetical protein